ncbi:MAG: hypothetical protein H0U50_06580 [Pyrinomonadaceae bacterium]|nr:hypothetical protein [Pyrinomonadaceae bacterium]
MLEQELHNQESNDFNYQETSVRKNATESDLFRNYEIKNWDFSPRIYKILAASAIFNVMALLIFAQSNLLTRKGCDSPMVSKVCQVLDTVYIGSVLLGTDKEFASKDYEKTELEDAEITYIDVSGQTPPLNYPEGYFALANPEEFAMRQQQQQMMNGDLSGFSMPPTGSISTNPTLPGNDLMNVTPTLPPQNNNPIAGGFPTSPYSVGSNPTIKTPTFQGRRFPRPKQIKPPKIKNQSPIALPDFGTKTAKKEKEDADEKADKEAEREAEKEAKKEQSKQPDISSLPVAEDIINKKPLQDFGDDVLDKVTAKKVDLSKPFLIEMQGAITKDGKFDQKKSKYVKTDGDQEMVNVAKSAIEAIGDSGLLTYLQKLGVENISFTLVQDDKQIYAIISSDQKSESKAKTISSGLNTAISLGKATVKEQDTLALLNAAKVETKGKNFVLNFNLDKPIAQELINRQLIKAQAKRQEQQQTNGTAENNSNLKSSK